VFHASVASSIYHGRAMSPPLPLSSDRWTSLRHAYGAAVDTPGRLARLAAGDISALEELWSSIAHQGHVYPAAVAAFPHLVDAARSAAWHELRFRILHLAGWIRAWVPPRTLAAVSADVRASFEEAGPDATGLVGAVPPGALESDALPHLLQASASLSDFPAAGRALEGLESEEFTPTCPSCGRQLYVWRVGAGLALSTDDPVTTQGTAFVSVHTALPSPGLAPMHAWLSAEAARIGLRSAPVLDALFGEARCAACGRAFCLMERLIEERSP
jgi:hypothetical protein